MQAAQHCKGEARGAAQGAIGYGMNTPAPCDVAVVLEAAAFVAVTLDNFVRPYAVQSRPLSRAEKMAALHAAIAAYERLW